MAGLSIFERAELLLDALPLDRVLTATGPVCLAPEDDGVLLAVPLGDRWLLARVPIGLFCIAAEALASQHEFSGAREARYSSGRDARASGNLAPEASSGEA